MVIQSSTTHASDSGGALAITAPASVSTPQDDSPHQAQTIRYHMYDDDQGPLLARIYFPDTKIFELHENGYIQYQSFKDQITGDDEPEEAPREDHPVEFYAPLALGI